LRRPPIDLRGRLLPFAERWRDAVLAAAVVGFSVGLIVAGCQRLTLDVLLDRVRDLPLWVVLAAPAAGLVLCAATLRGLAGGASPGISDAYIESFHDPRHDLPVRDAPGRTLASVLTLGFGGALGLEGLALYVGSSVGTAAQQRLRRLFRPSDTKVLLVAGAAAGLAAVFKAPATGAVFALEVPYWDDLARRKLVPALVGAATGYLGYVAVNGTAPIFPVEGAPHLDATAIVGSLVLGVVAGVGARMFARLLQHAKRFERRRPLAVRLPLAGVSLALLVGAGRMLTDETLVLGPGYDALRWALEPGHGTWILLALLALRCLATAATLAGGGAGGLFIPLVVAGALLGRAAGVAVGQPADEALFLVVGVAAFLGAGYRVPLAAVMFVAESTGRATFVVPGLLAAVAAYLVMGNASVADGQIATGGTTRPGGAGPPDGTGAPAT